jgi:hypothetical protein
MPTLRPTGRREETIGGQQGWRSHEDLHSLLRAVVGGASLVYLVRQRQIAKRFDKSARRMAGRVIVYAMLTGRRSAAR